MTKVFRSAPLPFQGQKRKLLPNVEEKLRRLSSKVHTIVDLFGGSGLLSYTAKRICPHCEVIYNDFDDYHIRLEHIEETNAILNYLREALKDVPKDKRVPEDIQSQIIDFLAETEKQNGYVDYLTISSAILFSTVYEKNLEGLGKHLFWNKVPLKNYTIPDGYLDGLMIKKLSYLVLMQDVINYTGGGKTILFLADPPYENTDVSAYTDMHCWNITEYLKLIHLLADKNYIYFTSNKSQLIDIFKFFGQMQNFKTPFFGAQIETTQNAINYQSGYTDIMISRFLPGCYLGDGILPGIDESLVLDRINF